MSGSDARSAASLRDGLAGKSRGCFATIGGGVGARVLVGVAGSAVSGGIRTAVCVGSAHSRAASASALVRSAAKSDASTFVGSDDNAGIGGGVGARDFSAAIGCGVGGRGFAGSTDSAAIGCGVGGRGFAGSTDNAAIGCGVGGREANGGENGANVGSTEGSDVARGFATHPFVTTADGDVAAIGAGADVLGFAAVAWFASVAFDFGGIVAALAGVAADVVGFVPGFADDAGFAGVVAAALSFAAVAAPDVVAAAAAGFFTDVVETTTGATAGRMIGVPIAWVLRSSGTAGTAPVRRNVFVVVRGFPPSAFSSQPSSSCFTRTGSELAEADCFTSAARFDSIACGVC
jgi:hypothetical protein